MQAPRENKEKPRKHSEQLRNNCICFHVQEHQFTTESLHKLLDAENPVFCGFMLLGVIKKHYQQHYQQRAGAEEGYRNKRQAYSSGESFPKKE